MTQRRPSPARTRLMVIAFAVALVTAPALLLTGPATAEDDPWAGSGFDATYDLTESSTLDELTGVFRRQGLSLITDELTSEDGFVSGGKFGTSGCGDIETSARFTEGLGNQRSFAIERQGESGPEFEFPCNGTYQVSITARAFASNNATKTIGTAIRVAVPPVPARDIVASVDDESDTTSSTTESEADDADEGDQNAGASADSAAVEVSWSFPSEPEPDATYVVQRSGPDSGSFKAVSDVLDADDDGDLVDTVSFSGTYDYRVMALRPGATDDDTVTTASASTSVEVTGLPDPPSDNDDDDDGDDEDDGNGDDDAGAGDGDGGAGTPGTGSLPHLGGSGQGGSSNGSTGQSTRPTVTTLDTGYDETLDYGDLAEPGELAAEGQSIIRSPNYDGPAYLPAVAGGLVLLGWAGHAFYLSRLARQF